MIGAFINVYLNTDRVISAAINQNTPYILDWLDTSVFTELPDLFAHTRFNRPSLLAWDTSRMVMLYETFRHSRYNQPLIHHATGILWDLTNVRYMRGVFRCADYNQPLVHQPTGRTWCLGADAILVDIFQGMRNRPDGWQIFASRPYFQPCYQPLAVLWEYWGCKLEYMHCNVCNYMRGIPGGKSLSGCGATWIRDGCQFLAGGFIGAVATYIGWYGIITLHRYLASGNKYWKP